jgi:hypothetical protein
VTIYNSVFPKKLLLAKFTISNDFLVGSNGKKKRRKKKREKNE